jgi:hypothetical protein
MHKNTFFTGQPIFNQVLSLIPHTIVNRLSAQHKTDRYCKKFRGYDHLVTMLYSSLHRCGSLREVITGMQAISHRLCHLGLVNSPRRSTLADANVRTSHEFFSDLYHELYRLYCGVLPDSRKGRKKDSDNLFIIDSSTISLFSQAMQGAGRYGANGKKKGGAKAHTVLNAKHDLPCYMYLSEAKVSDLTFLKQVDFLPKGSIVVMDKGYNSYKKLIEWTANDITWVMRINGKSRHLTLSSKNTRIKGYKKILLLS